MIRRLTRAGPAFSEPLVKGNYVRFKPYLQVNTTKLCTADYAAGIKHNPPGGGARTDMLGHFCRQYQHLGVMLVPGQSVPPCGIGGRRVSDWQLTPLVPREGQDGRVSSPCSSLYSRLYKTYRFRPSSGARRP